MADVPVTGLHHLRLTVTDLARSKAFYTEVLGFTVVAESPGDPADPAVRSDPDQLYGGCVLAGYDILLGLRPVADPADRFDSARVGLDHLSFTVESREVLDAAARRLAERDVVHGQARELAAFGIVILSFDDPDGIHLELTAPLPG
ncbi:VOC family protein [Actinophytocola sp.]|uniref:VOC family protein n=1 Tax=Actinophytocola sp. TaxID=1872138 RepID=UPI002D7EA5A9|nr:VOC family protein [Actinophytocola sp.]HET9138983.1 VOC family protein [Actinophytocola sp.]